MPHRFSRGCLIPRPIRETIARGVSNGQIAHVGKVGKGKYLPFNFERSITAFDVEISEEIYIITKERAEAYRQQIAKPERTAETEPLLPGIDGVTSLGSQPTSVKPTQSPLGQKSGPIATQLPLELTWSGQVPSQKWMNFYTKFLTKLGVGNDLSLNVNVKCKPQGGLSPQKVEEIKSALRELGLDDTLN